MSRKANPSIRDRFAMAACSNGPKLRRRWLLTLSMLAAFAVIAFGVLLWQAVELDSLSAVSARVEQAKPFLGGLRLALIGALALIWPRLLPSPRALWMRPDGNDETNLTRWMALRWRVFGWLLVIELIIGHNLFGRFFSAAVHSA